MSELNIFKILNILLFLEVLNTASESYKQQPEIKSEDGSLSISSVSSRNITFRIKGDGGLFVNSMNILNSVEKKRDALHRRFEDKQEISTSQNLRSLLESFKDDLRILVSRFAILQNRTRGRTQTLNIRHSLGRIRQVLTRATQIENNLIINECQEVGGNGTRCKHGGICYDGYKDFHCECPQGWMGSTCEEDIDECYLLVGTDLGCQNNADCINTFGSYSCSCHSGFYGSHCRLRNSVCDDASRGELCGHGTCVNSKNDAGITCICDQGWTKNKVIPEAACNIDVNECDEATNPCHDQCINLPGSFKCSPCPSGYTGNGVFCTDIDECTSNNGGCSIQPKVSCINTEGSFHCGNCPTGWQGDGRICESTEPESCESKNICYPSAKCVYISNTVVCTCPPSMYGHGFGADGCGVLPLSNACGNHTCQNNGSCEVFGSGTRCICSSGYMGPKCEQPDACQSEPCHNGGTCTLHLNNTYRCECLRGTTGPTCEIVRDVCGSILREQSGSLTYPPDGGSYLPNERCAWLLRTSDSMVLNITFFRFNLEIAADCSKDWLQMHDGRFLASRLIGRFCGDSLPLGGNIQTSQNALFFWFRSDSENNGAGFNLTWRSIAPTCGGIMDLEGGAYGIIRSPGYPGKTPPIRDCEWQLNAPFGYRFLLRFFEINLGGTIESNCTRDTLKIFDSDQLLRSVCETSLPEPLHSSSNTIHLHFHTDSFGTDSSFQLHYEIVPSAPQCGGVFTEPSGIISGYVNGRICSYLIKQPVDTKIMLDFIDFNLLKSESCYLQKVEVYDGSTDENVLLKRLCGNQTEMKSIVSTDNAILIRYEYLFPGVTLPMKFEIKYERVCESEIVNAEDGIFTTPNYPNSYLEHMDCTFTIRGPINTVVHINFTDFSISKNKAHLEVQNISNTSRANDESYVDVYLSKNVVRRYYEGTFLHLISEKNYMQVVFHGGANEERARGIRVEYSFQEMKCGGILTGESGHISHSAVTGPSEENCEWVIEVPRGKHIQLDLAFLRLDFLNCNSGEMDISIYSNDTLAEGHLLLRFCEVAKRIRESFYTNTLTVILHMRRNLSTRVEFGANYAMVDNNKVCGGEFSARYGVIKTPSWPNSYDDLMNCTWIVSAPIGHKIELVITNFSLEAAAHNCNSDYLEIRNGDNMESPLIGRYCGRNVPARIPSFTNHLYLHFVSDSFISDTGFYITWEQTETGCGGKLNSHKGSIHSPHNYDINGGTVACDWHITISRGSQIIIKITSIEDNLCNQQLLSVYDGPNVDKSKLKFVCANSSNSVQLKTSSNQATIVYNFAKSGEQNGLKFIIDYDTDCSVNLDGIQGVIESPNFPDTYPAGLICFWDIHGGQNNKFQLIFSHLDIELRDGSCSFDYIDFFDLHNDDVLSKQRLCSNPRKSIFTEGNRFQIKFVTDYSEHATGFRLEYKRIGCGELLTSNFGVIQSPNAPFSTGLNCDWDIEVGAGKIIVVNFEVIHIETEQGDCSEDGIIVSDEKNSTDYMLKECRIDPIPVTVTSAANHLHIHFYTSNTRLRKYIRGTYTTRDSFCGGNFRGNSGRIKYPPSGDISGIGTECVWMITVENSYGIDLVFDSVNTTCRETSLELWKVIDSSEHLIQKICGNILPAKQLVESNQLKVVYKANLAVLGNFSFRFKKVCGGFLNDTVGYIKSQLHEHCEWKIESQGTHIFLDILKLECDCSKQENCTNGLKLVDGIGKNELNRFCDNHQSNIAISTNSLIIYTSKIELIAKYSTVYSSCGGIITTFRGILTSPFYPLSYPSNVECVWEIKASAGNSIQFNIDELDIATSENCNDDFLEIRQSDQSGKIIRLYCSNETELEDFVIYEKAWIKFRSVKGSTGNGFRLSWNYAHYNELNSTMGSIESPPLSSIRNQEAFTWRILLPRGNFVFIEFVEYNNGLTLYDGFDDTALNVPILESPWQYTSSSNVLYLVSNNNELESFKIDWRSVNNRVAQTNVSRSDCNNTFVLDYTSRLEIFSPGYPYGYANNLDCEWTFKPADPTEHILLSIHDVKLEPENDYLQILSSTNLRDWHKELEISESNDIKLISGSPYLKLILHTDSSFNRTGFKSIARTECGSNMTGITGQITLNNVIRASKSKLVCKWHFEVPPGKKILLRFDYSNNPLPKTEPCRQYAIVYDGFDYNAPILSPGHICNQQGHNVKSLESSTNRLIIKYNLNWTNAFEREILFNLTYQEIGDCDTEIQLTHYHNSVNISSPNYPNVPNPYTDCNWIVIGPVGETLHAEFLDRFSMNTRYCDKEFVELFDGSTELSRSFGRFCTKPNVIRSTGNILRLHYLSNINEPRNGFRVNVSIAKCGGTYTIGTGEISSVGYPTIGAYPKPSICEYTVKMPEHSRMRLNFSDIDLPYASTNLNRSDRIDIISRNDNEKTITLYGNTTLPTILDLDTNEIVLRFISFSGNGLHRGFKLKFQRLYGNCFRDVNNDAGILKFSSMPQMPGHVKCGWKIRVPKGQRVTFEFLEFEAQSSANNTDRFIQLYGGSPTPKVSFYNDFYMVSKIKEVHIDNFNFSQKVQSSDNFMYVVISFNPRFTSIRILKARYSSNDESNCPPDINEQATGSIDTKKLPTTANFFCTSKFVLTGAETITFVVNELVINRINSSNWNTYAISFTSDLLPTQLFENITGLLVSLPFKSGYINMVQNDNVKINRFSANFYRSSCGGKFSIMDDFKIVFPPENFFHQETEDAIECAWILTGGSESRRFRLLGNVSLSHDCNKEYLTIHSGSNTQLIAKICHNSTELLSGIDLKKYLTFITYHSSSFNSKSSSSLEIKTEISIACNTEIMVRSTSRLVSVNSKTYKNNMECNWEFKTYEGLYMSVNFFGRFFIETSANCSKDYLEIYGYENEIWQPKERFCGRELPITYNATSHRMLIIFRTDNTTTGDGFTFGVSSACRATFNVTEELKTVQTPNIERSRFTKFDCSYTFVTNSDKAINLHVKPTLNRMVGSWDRFIAYRMDASQNGTEVKITEFFDSVEISEQKYLRIVFAFSFTHNVFQLDYQLNLCGGNITQSTNIRSLSASTSYSGSNSVYENNMNCAWSVLAPPDHSILIRFKYFDMEAHKNCIFDFVSIYSGSFTRSENELVKLCGNLTEDPPLISVDGNRALVKAVSDGSNARKGFLAEVVFVRNCNERIALTNDESVVTQPLVMIRNYTLTSSEELHCQIRVTAPEGYRVTIQMRNLDINKRQCLDRMCGQCNYVEVIETSDQSNKPLSMGKFCSENETKRKFITSDENALLQFSFTKEGNYTIEIILEIEKSTCGRRNELELQHEKELVIKFPSDGSNYLSNTHCTWRIRSERNYQIHFETFLLQSPDSTTGECVDYLRITYEMATKSYCGKATGFTYIRNNLNPGEYTDLTFHSDDTIEDKGFILKISSQQLCNRTHTKLSGSINFEKHADSKKSCVEELRVPNDYVINLHMRLFTDNHVDQNCSDQKLQISDMSTNRTLQSRCVSYYFETHLQTNTSTIRISTNSIDRFDLDYFASPRSAEPGCGGEIYAVKGTIYSPDYGHRNFSECRWLITMPEPNHVEIYFTTFDMGSKVNCDFDYVNIIEISAGGEEKLAKSICGNEYIEGFASKTSKIAIVAKKSPNFNGIGWVDIDFNAMHPDLGNELFLKLDKFYKVILHILNAEVKDQASRELLLLKLIYKDILNDSKYCIVLLLLHAVLQPQRQSKTYKPTIGDAQSEFITLGTFQPKEENDV